MLQQKGKKEGGSCKSNSREQLKSGRLTQTAPAADAKVEETEIQTKLKQKSKPTLKQRTVNPIGCGDVET